MLTPFPGWRWRNPTLATETSTKMGAQKETSQGRMMSEKSKIAQMARQYLLEPVHGRFKSLADGAIVLLRSASGAVLLTIMATLIGLVGGLYSKELRSYYPWCVVEQMECTGYAWKISAFYSALLAFALLFYLRERATSINADKREAELLSAIRTMPPANVMQSFEFAYKIFLSHVEESDLIVARGNNSLAEIDEGIRNGLDAMTVLAADFQRIPGARYAANIMLFRATSDIPDGDLQGVFERLGPYEDGRSLEGLAGILDLQPELSASTDDQDDSFDADPSLKPMALPVPKVAKSKNNGQKNYLPGAPTALFEGRYLVDDTHRLLAIYETQREYDLPPGIFQKIDCYFRETNEGQKVRSFMSLLLYYREPGPVGDENMIGVVNIHSDRVNLFAGRELAAHYESLCQPFILGLARMIRNRQKLQELISQQQSMSPEVKND